MLNILLCLPFGFLSFADDEGIGIMVQSHKSEGKKDLNYEIKPKRSTAVSVARTMHYSLKFFPLKLKIFNCVLKGDVFAAAEPGIYVLIRRRVL